jgi:ATP-binding cassette subfamily B protein
MLAISSGGLLVSFRALLGLSRGVHELVAARIAWRDVVPLFEAAARPVLVGRPDVALRAAGATSTVLEASDLVFGYPGRGEPVIRGCDFRIAVGDRVLLQGPSGSGKTTFAALLTGLRVPQSGLVLLRGLDRKTLGTAEWMRRVAAAPQFHENHVLTETMAFNLLMGREWPPTPADLAEAEAICEELGLGELLQRMPAGILQTVGDTGWQLSHGERSRVYIARALLQDADVVVLDESFAALDPGNLRRALACVLSRARSVLVIAHP